MSPRRIGARRVRVQVDVAHATLRPVVARPGAPRSVAELDIANLRQRKAPPLSSGRQFLAALAAELVGQRPLLPVRMAENDRAKLAQEAAVRAQDLLAPGHRLPEQSIGSTRHAALIQQSARILRRPSRADEGPVCPKGASSVVRADAGIKLRIRGDTRDGWRAVQAKTLAYAAERCALRWTGLAWERKPTPPGSAKRLPISGGPGRRWHYDRC
jgi:hypothetical protein